MLRDRIKGLTLGIMSAVAALSISAAHASAKTVVSVAYSSNYVFDTDDLATRWWGGVKTEFEKKFPDATLQLVPIGGGFNDIITKLSLLYRSPKTAPDVAQVPTSILGQLVSAGFLMPLNDDLAKADWWQQFPPVIKEEGTFDSKVYGVSSGENVTLLYYDKEIFQKAGIATPWAPKTWDDILAAARLIKQKVPGVVPLFIKAGTAAGSNGMRQSAENLLAGSVTPVIYDENTKKWVVDSPGLRQVLGFYKSVYSDGLGVPLSDLQVSSVGNIPLHRFPKGTLGIGIGGNYFGGNWTQTNCAPCWPDAAKVMGAAPIPTVNGQAPGVASTLAAFDFVVSATAKDKRYAWELLNIMMGRENQVNSANWAGFVPGSQDAAKDPALLDFAPPFNAIAAGVVPYGKLTPRKAEYEVWAHGLQEATGALAQTPDTTVDQAIEIMKSYVTNQLGEDAVEVLK